MEADRCAELVARRDSTASPSPLPRDATGVHERPGALVGGGDTSHRVAPGGIPCQSTPGQSADLPPVASHVLRLPGQPLDPATRVDMESRFGRDFRSVRIHTDQAAAAAAQAINADAFTWRNQIVFDTGRYHPDSTEGRRLLGHELTHTLQHDGAPHGSAGGTPVLQRQQSQRPAPGPHADVNLDPSSADVVLTEAIRALGDITFHGQLTQPLNLLGDATGVSLGLPRSQLSVSLAYNDRCNRALQTFLIGVHQQQAAGHGVFDFSDADWSARAGAGIRIGGLRIDASGEASFHGDEFQALAIALTFTTGVSQALPEECRRGGPGPEPSEGGGGEAGQLCAGIDCARPPTPATRDRYRLCCVLPPTPRRPELPPRTLYFFYDTSILKPESNATLDQLVDALTMLPSAHVQITGHTSLEGTERYNERLSRARAEAARDLLVLGGIDPSRIHVLWLGEYAPAVAEPPEPRPGALRLPANEAIRDLNRRAEVVFFDPSGTIEFLPRSAPLTLSTHPWPHARLAR